MLPVNVNDGWLPVSTQAAGKVAPSVTRLKSSKPAERYVESWVVMTFVADARRVAALARMLFILRGLSEKPTPSCA